MSIEWTTCKQDDGGAYQYGFDDKCLAVAEAEAPKSILRLSRAMCEWIRDHGIPLLDKHNGSRPVQKESSMLRNAWHSLEVLEVAREFFSDGKLAGLAIRMVRGQKPLGLDGRGCWLNNLGVQKLIGILSGETHYTGNRMLTSSDPHRFCTSEYSLSQKKDIRFDTEGREAALGLIREFFLGNNGVVDMEDSIVELLIQKIKDEVKSRSDQHGAPTRSELEEDVLPYVRDDLGKWFGALCEELRRVLGINKIVEIRRFRFLWDGAIAGVQFDRCGILAVTASSSN